MAELREPTQEEIKRMHSHVLYAHEQRVGPMLDALRTRLTAAQRAAFFNPCYHARSMNAFDFRRVFEPSGGLFAGKGVLVHFFCIMDAPTRTPCWVARFKIGVGAKTRDKGKRPQWEKLGKVRPAMTRVLDELGGSLMEGCGGKPKARMGEDRMTYYYYRPFTPHERDLANPIFLATAGVRIGPIDVLELVEEKKQPGGLILPDDE